MIFVMEIKYRGMIDCATPELALAIAGYLETKGFTRSNYISADMIELRHFMQGPRWFLSIDKYVTWYTSNPKVAEVKGAPQVASLKEFLDLAQKEQEPEIKIGEYVAKFDATGVQVGCQQVPWETIEAILARKPKQ
jgi:hypothetical protein